MLQPFNHLGVSRKGNQLQHFTIPRWWLAASLPRSGLGDGSRVVGVRRDFGARSEEFAPLRSGRARPVVDD